MDVHERLAVGAAALERFLVAPPPAWLEFAAYGGHEWLGVLYEKQGRPAAALAEYEAVLAVAPANSRAREGVERLSEQ